MGEVKESAPALWALSIVRLRIASRSPPRRRSYARSRALQSKTRDERQAAWATVLGRDTSRGRRRQVQHPAGASGDGECGGGGCGGDAKKRPPLVRCVPCGSGFPQSASAKSVPNDAASADAS